MADKGYANYPKLDFDRDIEILLKELDPITEPTKEDTVVIFSTRNHYHYNYIYPLFAKELLERNIPTYFLFFHPIIAKYFPSIELNKIQVTNSLRVQEYPYLYRSGQIGYPYYEWNVDLENERITMEGLEDINIFYPIRSTMQKQQKRYNIDFNEPRSSMAVQRALFTADEVFRHLQLYTSWAERLNLTVRIVGWETPYVPHGYLDLFCKSENSPDSFEYVHLSTFYGHYFGDAESFGTDLGVTNLTSRNVHRKYKGFKEEFDEYEDRILTSPEKTQKVKEEVLENMREHSVGNPRMSKSMFDENRDEVIFNKVNQVQDEGDNVFALFGHKFYDVGMTDTSEAFEDMCDWIDYTIEVFKDRDDLLILKPHPAEVDKENPSTEPNETMSDYIDTKLPENIILLEPRDMNSTSIYNIIDYGLIWRSTVGLEMICFGIPCLIVGDAYYKEYTQTHGAATKEEYRRKIGNMDELEISAEAQTDAAVFFHFFKNERHYHLDQIQGTNYKDLHPREVRYDPEKIREFLEKSDNKIQSFLPEFNLEQSDDLDFILNEDLASNDESVI